MIELLSTGQGLLWLAEKGDNHQKLLIAEYEPKGGGSAFLREFKSWYERLKTLPADLLPVLYTRTIIEERLVLVFEVPVGQSAENLIKSRRTLMPAHEFFRRLLTLTQRFSELLPGSSHGWIRGETVMFLSDSRILLGPPAFTPGEPTHQQSDLEDCAFLTARLVRAVSPRALHADGLEAALPSYPDWALGAAIEWILLCKDRAPQAAGPVIEFLGEAIQSQRRDSECELAAALNTLKSLYVRSGSKIINREIAKTEDQLSGIRKANQPRPEPTPEPKPAPSDKPAHGIVERRPPSPVTPSASSIDGDQSSADCFVDHALSIPGTSESAPMDCTDGVSSAMQASVQVATAVEWKTVWGWAIGCAACAGAVLAGLRTMVASAIHEQEAWVLDYRKDSDFMVLSGLLSAAIVGGIALRIYSRRRRKT